MNTQLTAQSGGFALKPQSMNEAMQMASMISSSNMIPKSYQGKDGDTLIAMMMGAELGLNPIQSLQNIAVINGRPALWGDSMMALVQNHPKFGGISEAFDEITMVATCTIWRKGGEKHVVQYSQADAQTAKLWGKQGPWTQYPKRMLQLRARGFALRDQFADALSGLISTEEAEDMPAQNSQSHEAIVKPLDYCSQEKFNENKQAWSKIITSGKKDANGLIATLETKTKLTDEQKIEIASWGTGEAA